MLQVVYPDGSLHPQPLKKLVQNTPRTVLYFYPKDNTPGCTKEANEFTNLHDQFKELNTQVVGVSKDGVNAHRSFIEKHDLDIPLISDTDLELHNQFDTRGEKNVFGKTVEGTIRSTFILNKDMETIHSRRNVKSSGHAGQVYARIKTNLA